jgi:hypothetical protein
MVTKTKKTKGKKQKPRQGIPEGASSSSREMLLRYRAWTPSGWRYHRQYDALVANWKRRTPLKVVTSDWERSRSAAPMSMGRR